MSEFESETRDVSSVFFFEGGIDVRPYLAALVKYWYLIVGGAVLAALAAGAFVLLQPTTYTAEADVTLLDVRSVITFDPTFTTVADDAGQQTDRRSALRALAQSDSLVAELFGDVREELELGANNVTRLKQALNTDVSGDLLRLQVTWDDPEEAALIANAWVGKYVQLANRSFVSTSSQSPEEAQVAAGEAFGRYQEAQGELEAFIRESTRDQLERELLEVEQLSSDLHEKKIEALQLLNTTGLIAASEMVTRTRAALLDEVSTALVSDSEDQIRELEDWYTRKRTLEALALRLRDLRAQVAAGDNSTAATSGDALALLFARSGLLDNVALPPDLQLQIDLTQLAENYSTLSVGDVDTLLTIVDEGLVEADARIGELTQALFLTSRTVVSPTLPAEHQLFDLASQQAADMLATELTLAPGAAELSEMPLSRTLDDLSTQHQLLAAQIENVQAQEQELRRNRDAAWELYKTLENKALEVEAQFATGSPQARLALSAVTPSVADQRSLAVVIATAAALGALTAIVFIVLRTYWQSAMIPAEVSTPAGPA